MRVIMNVLEQERLNRILNARPAYRKGIIGGNNQNFWGLFNDV